MSSPPLPAQGEFIARTRQTCASVREHANIKVNTSAIDTHLKALDRATFDRLKTSHGVSFPLTFPTLESEINFLSVLSLLNTLSGYRSPLHRIAGQGAYQSVIKLLFGLYISSNDDEEGNGLLSARGLETLDAQTICSIWNVSIFEEQPHPDLPGVTVGTQAGVMNEIVQMVVRVCNETGKILRDDGWRDLGQFVADVLKDAQELEEEKRADWVVQKIVTLIPGFRDISTVLNPPEPVYIFKKVFFLLFALHQRLPLRARSNPGEQTLQVPNPQVLPMFVDNVLPTMCVHLGFIDLSECTVPALRAWGATATATTDIDANGVTDGMEEGKKKVQEGPSLSKEEAYIVRAATVDAGRIAVERAHALALEEKEGLGWLAEMTEADLDGYLWSVAKDDSELRKVPRMVELETIMY